ncbi:hypothetical protein J6590_001531 [Homalodisca vitripennis]|nr:hypothetical protein J6590_001531 [Homalodisca vitripennis]
MKASVLLFAIHCGSVKERTCDKHRSTVHCTGTAYTTDNRLHWLRGRCGGTRTFTSFHFRLLSVVATASVNCYCTGLLDQVSLSFLAATTRLTLFALPFVSRAYRE